jgi:hypothetical protein
MECRSVQFTERIEFGQVTLPFGSGLNARSTSSTTPPLSNANNNDGCTSSIFPASVALGDVDNDRYGDHELVVGSIGGTLMIYKGSGCDAISTSLSTTDTTTVPTGVGAGNDGDGRWPWRVCYDLGTITAVAIGDVRNHKRNSLVIHI